GLSISIKGGERSLFESSIRYAKAFKNNAGKEKFALKINGYYLRAHDWEANNSKPTEQSLDNEKNPGGYDAVNKYGDEFDNHNDYTSSVKTFPGLKRIYRTGYWEKDLVDYNTRNFKTAAILQYKLTDSVDVILGSNFGTGTTVYQGDNRYSLKNILFFQNKIEVRKKDKFFIRAYATNEDAGKSYDAYFTALLLQKNAKSDLDWNTDYRNYWQNKIVPEIKLLTG
ncbi:MAG: TonB-dependent receptor, partial [Ignavibacteria bacterium]|nr:TonB-dependent receptor [Ignavibacteria bacterium]